MMMDFWRVVPKKRVVKINAKKGVIFYNPNEFRKSIFRLGNALLIFGLIYLIYLYFPLTKVVVSYNFFGRSKAEVKKEEQVLITESKAISTPAPENNTFEIQIPKLTAQAKVVENINPFDPNEYKKALENDNVAQASLSSKPGHGNGSSTYIFAHSTEQSVNMIRKNAVFYLLGDLKKDDLVFINYKGVVYKYRIYDQKVVSAKDIQYLTYKDEKREVLILQTCWPIGTAWKRLLVFGERF